MNLFQESKNILDKDGKVNPLGPYGRSKLTGRETSTYFRRNKVKDAKVRRAVEVALDLGGADSIARKEIKKFYGDKILKSKEVQAALKYANEEVQEAVSPAQQAAIAISKKERGEKPKNEDAEAKAKLNLKHTQDMEKLKAKQAREKEAMSENYRTLAQKGMGAEDKKRVKVGLMIDYYTKKDGSKRQGKIVSRDSKGYTVKDDNDGKMHTFVYHDRAKAKKLMAAHEPGHIEEGKLHVKMFTGRDPAGIKVKKIGSDPRGGRDVMMTGPDNKLIAFAVRSLGVDKATAKKGLKAVQKELGDMIGEEFKDVDKAKKNPFKALGFSQHPHKGFEGERMPKGMRDFRKKALTPTDLMKKKMNVMDSYRAMWEEGEKYAPVEENMERSIMKKMRKGKVAKGMPR